MQAVEEVVHPLCKEAKIEDGKKPYDVFIVSHEELVKAGEKWTKDTASCYIAVVSLVLTIMFAAAFTIPGGNNQTRTPNSLDQNTFKMFLLADSVSIITSATSVLFFISILTSRCHAIDFLKVLPMSLVFHKNSRTKLSPNHSLSLDQTQPFISFSAWIFKHSSILKLKLKLFL